jgi:hypothetical protein
MVWIARVDFAGFGNLSGEKIEFEERKVNLVLESDTVGKATVFGAIYATLFNFSMSKKLSLAEMTEKERFSPLPETGLPYIAGMDLFMGQRYLKVIRDFTEDAVQIVDMSRNNTDVTAEFFGSGGEDTVGNKLTGMTQEVFRKLSVVTSPELSESRVGRFGDLTKVMKEMVSQRSATFGPDLAVATIDDALTQFPHQGRKLRGATVVRELEGRYYDLSDKVRRIEQERKNKGLSVETAGAPARAASGQEQGLVSEYFENCMEVADIDKRLVKAEETLARVQELRQELERLSSLEFFSVELQKYIEELFTRRQSRQQDFESLVSEYADKIKEFDEKQKKLGSLYVGLDVFSSTDAQTLNALAQEFQVVSKELSDFHLRRRMEIERLRGQGIDLASLDEIRRLLHELSSQDYEDARTFNATLISSRKQIDDAEEIFNREKVQLVEIDRQRKVQSEKNKNHAFFYFLLTLVPALGTGIGIFQYRQSCVSQHPLQWLLVVSGLGAVVMLILLSTGIFMFVRFKRPKYYKQKEYSAAQMEMNQQTRLIKELKEKIANLELKFDALAHKVRLVDGHVFLQMLNEYTSKAAFLRELEMIEQLIATREASVAQLKQGVEPYFARAGRMTQEIRPETTTQLAESINGYVTEAKRLINIYGPIKTAKEQVGFLTNEIKGIEKELLEAFIQAKMEHLHDFNASYKEFYEKVQVYHQWQQMKLDLNEKENDMSSGFVPDELPPQIQRLETTRKEKLVRMQALLERCHGILDIAPGASRLQHQMMAMPTYSTKNPPAVTKVNVEKLKSEQHELEMMARSASTSDANYVVMLQELRAVQSELTIVRRVKTALEHARGRILQGQSTGVSDWVVKLNEIMDDMLSQMGIEFPKYESAFADLPEAQDAPSSGPLLGKPFSLQTMEQVRWFARAVVVRVLALKHNFPLILNEPFGMGPEPLRENNLSYIFGLAALGFQIIALTSEASRFEAAYTSASAEQRLSLHTCARVSLT